MNTKRITALVLSLCMLICMLSVTAIAAETAPQYSGGSGTASDPYLISTADDLLAMTDTINNGVGGTMDAVDECGLGQYHGYYFKQIADIDMSGKTWTSMNFSGVYDGCGNTIKNLSVADCQSYDGENYEYTAGFFGQLVNATVKNIAFENCTATISSTIVSDRDIYVAIVAGSAIASKFENIRVINPAVEQNGEAFNMGYAGGICGLSDISNFTGCIVEGGNISAGTSETKPQHLGGITGNMGDMFYEFVADYGNPYNMVVGAGSPYGIFECSVTSDITSDAKGGYASGIVAMTDTMYLPEGGVTIQDCFFGGNVTITSASGRASGISGWDEPNDKIINCVVATKNISGPTSAVKFGNNVGTVTNSYYLSDAETEDSGRTAEQFASGDITALLGPAWTQNIGTDSFPVLIASVVTAITNYADQAATVTVKDAGAYIVVFADIEDGTLNKVDSVSVEFAAGETKEVPQENTDITLGAGDKVMLYGDFKNVKPLCNALIIE